MEALHRQIAAIADRVATCGRQCEEVVNCPEEGRPPRGLILELRPNANTRRGVVVVGQNPGMAGDEERALYQGHGVGYRQQLLAWDRVQNVAYFERLRRSLGLLGLDGPVLWTDVVKCEGSAPSAEAKKTCADEYLVHELEAAPNDWPVLAAGGVAFKTCSSLAGDHPVLGFFHPTGRWTTGVFSRYLERLVTDPALVGELREFLAARGGRRWLPGAVFPAEKYGCLAPA